MKIKFRNALNIKFSNALLASFFTIILYLIGLILQLIFKDPKNNILALKIFGIILLIIWVIKREDILECVYAKFFVNKSYYPEAGDMSFKLKPNGRRAKRKWGKGVYVDNSIGISYRNVKRMMELGYSITISNEMQNNKD